MTYKFGANSRWKQLLPVDWTGCCGKHGCGGVNTLKRVSNSVKQLFCKDFRVWYGDFQLTAYFFFRCLSFYNKIFSHGMC